MSAIDGKYVKINNQWQAWMELRREARGLQAPLQVVRKWCENVKLSQTRKFYIYAKWWKMCVHYVAGFCRLLKLKVLICKYFLFGLGHGLDRRRRSVQRKLQKWELYLKNLNTRIHTLCQFN